MTAPTNQASAQTTPSASAGTRASRGVIVTASTEPVSDPVAIEKFYSPIEIAAMFGVVRRTVISWLKDPNHTLKGVKLGNNTWRVSETALKAFLKEKYGNPAA